MADNFLRVHFCRSGFAIEDEAVRPWNRSNPVFVYEVAGVFLRSHLVLHHPIVVSRASDDFIDRALQEYRWQLVATSLNDRFELFECRQISGINVDECHYQQR